MIEVPPDCGLACWVIDRAGRRLRRVTEGPLEVPTDGVVEIRGLRGRSVRLDWLVTGQVPVFSAQLGRSRVSEDDLEPLFQLPLLAVLGLAGPAVTPAVVSRLPEMRSLAALDLKAHGLRAHDLVSLAAVARLRRIALEVPDAHAVGVIDLLYGRRLTGFGMLAPQVDAELIARLVRQWPLRTLSLSVPRLDWAVVDALSTASGLESISLAAEDSVLTADDVRRCVAALPRLTDLDLGIRGGEIPVEVLLAGWQLRPGVRLNGLALDERAAARLAARLR